MKTFFWFLVSGVVWLALIWFSASLDVPPQLISLAHSGYIGLFSVFLILEMKNATDASSEAGGEKPKASYLIRLHDLPWLFVPLLSVVLLSVVSKDVVIALKEFWLVFGFFCLCLLLLIFRIGRRNVRSISWEVIPPILFLVVIIAPDYLMAAVVAICLGSIFVMVSRSGGQSGATTATDSLFSQLPSLCIAPVVIIALRDHVDVRGVVERQYTEILGLVINGVGGALWGSIVIRKANLLTPLSLALWCGGAAVLFVAWMVDWSIASVAIGLVALELFRGCQWLGLTHLLLAHDKWVAFFLNLFLTICPIGVIFVADAFGLSDYRSLFIILGYSLVVIIMLIDRIWFRPRAVERTG